MNAFSQSYLVIIVNSRLTNHAKAADLKRKTQAVRLYAGPGTVLRAGKLRAVIYSNNHRPEHVHVIQAGKEVVFSLHCPDGPLEVRENYGFLLRELRKVSALLAGQIEHLCDRWRAIHGEP